MMTDDFIVYASTINGDGTGTLLEGQAVTEKIRAKELAWVHMNADHPETRKWLESELTYLDNIIVDALLEQETRPRIVEFEEGALLILRGVNLNQDAQPEDMISIRLWIDSHRIVSLQKRNLRAVKDIQDKLAAGKGPKNAGDFIAALSSRLFERMEPVFAELDEKIDIVEEKVMTSPDIGERQDIVTIRRQAIIFRRYIAPQRDVIAYLRTSEQSWLDAMQKRRLQESLDRVIRYVEDLDAIRERAQIVKDELASALADQLNKNMYVLSVIAAIFLPLGFLTGLLGINVGGIPGADNPSAFALFVGGLTALVVVQVILFKKFKWF